MTKTEQDFSEAVNESLRTKNRSKCKSCGAPTKDGRYHNDALLDETARRVEAENKLRNARARGERSDDG